MEAKTLNMYLEDLEVFREEKRDFTDYYHLLNDAIKDLTPHHLAGLTYALLNDVRNIGAEEEKYTLKQRMFEKINEL